MTELVIFGLIGAGIGGAYFFLLYRTVLLQSVDGPALSLLTLLAARVIGAGSAFWFIAQYGAGPLLTALGGFLITRLVAQRMARFA